MTPATSSTSGKIQTQFGGHVVGVNNVTPVNSITIECLKTTSSFEYFTPPKHGARRRREVFEAARLSHAAYYPDMRMLHTAPTCDRTPQYVDQMLMLMKRIFHMTNFRERTSSSCTLLGRDPAWQNSNTTWGSRCWGQQRDPCRTLESYVFELDIR